MFLPGGCLPGRGEDDLSDGAAAGPGRDAGNHPTSFVAWLTPFDAGRVHRGPQLVAGAD